MKTLAVYARIYATCFTEALKGAVKNSWTLLLPFALVVTFDLGSEALGMTLGRSGATGGFAAGIILNLIRAALISAYLYFIREIVSGSEVRLSELKGSFGAYFWSVINLFFVFWIAQLVVGLLLSGMGAVLFALYLVAAIALNAAPEVIAFRGTYGGTDTIRVAVGFLQANPLTWLLPNVFLFALVYSVQVATDGLLWFIGSILVGAALHLAMLFRGHLFVALDGTSHRQRMFRQRYNG